MKENILLTFQFIIFVAVQVFLLNQIHLFGFGCVFLYVLFVINFPFERSKISLVFLGFLLGVIIDFFTQSYGIHAFATTLIAYLRQYVIKLYTGSDDYEVQKKTYSGFGIIFYRYAGTMIFIHHLTLFSLEAFSFKYILPIIFKTLISTVLTMVFVFFIQSISVKKK
jgi:rod shape-determining protein MreD